MVSLQQMFFLANVLSLAIPLSAFQITNPMTKSQHSFTTPSTLRVQESRLFSSVSQSTNTMTMVQTQQQQKKQQQQETISMQRKERDLSKLEQEFRDMITCFSGYTEEDILSIPNPRLRALYDGVVASAYEPAVYRSFEVLFEDLGPLRVAGRMIFGKLKSQMETSIDQRQQEVMRLMTLTGLDEEELRASRLAFMSISQEGKGGHAVVTKQQLLDTGIANSFVDLMSFSNEQDFLKQLGGNEWRFESFIAALQLCTDSRSCSLDQCNPSTVLQEAMIRMPAPANIPVDPRKIKNMERYDMMVNKFKEWEDFVPKGEGRRLDILRGCFVGAENEKVVKALKIVYVDYSALRMAGDLIFSLMTALVSGKSHQN